MRNVNHTKRQISEPTFSSLKFLVRSFFLKKNAVCSERVTKPAEIARQTAKSLLKEVEILLLKGIRDLAARKRRSTFRQRKISDYFTQYSTVSFLLSIVFCMYCTAL